MRFGCVLGPDQKYDCRERSGIRRGPSERCRSGSRFGKGRFGRAHASRRREKPAHHCHGLLAIGTGLRLSDFKAHFSLIAASCIDRLVIMPFVAWGICTAVGLTPVEIGIAVLFAALSTAQPCFGMTAAMKGNAVAVANVTTAQTLCAMLTLPLWIIFVLSPLATH